MKLLLLAGTAFLGLAAWGSAARAVPFDFTYTGSLVTFTVPTTDTYQILAFGAQGGNGRYAGLFGVGGRGAEIAGAFSLTAGEILQIAVGGVGSDSDGGGGGGGSFVVGPRNTPLVIAGGGGGGGAVVGGPAFPGGGGLTGPDGGAGSAAAHVRLIVWCKECQHQVEPDPAEMAARYGAEMSVLDWRQRLVCSQCGSRQVDMVVTGEQRA